MAPASARLSLLCPSFPSSSSSPGPSRSRCLRVLAQPAVVFPSHALASSRSRLIRVLDRFHPVRATLAIDSPATDGDRLESSHPRVLLEVKNLEAVIAETRQTVLRGINLTIREGEVRVNRPCILVSHLNRFPIFESSFLKKF